MAPKTKKIAFEIKIMGGEIIGTVTRDIEVPISELKDYLLKHGFEYKGEWYFRKSWMRHNSFRLFEQAGLIKRLGTPNDLRRMGIEVPDTSEYNGKGSSQMYKVVDTKINNFISNRG